MKRKTRLICAGCVLPLVFSVQAWADQVILDDLVVDGSLCAGTGCVDGEVFDFDTVKLKSDNPLLRFEDTSTSSGFPTNDWAMGVEDSLTDTTSHFFINDANANATVLRMSSGASSGVALGANSTLEDGAITVGSTGNERRISYVDDGVDSTDAVNVGQFDQFKTDTADDLDAQFQALVDDVSDRVDELIARLDALTP